MIIFCTGRGSHKRRELDRVGTDGVGRWALASESGLPRWRRDGGRVHRRATTAEVPGAVAPVGVDNTVTLSCPCGVSLTLRGDRFGQFLDDFVAHHGVAHLDLSRVI